MAEPVQGSAAATTCGCPTCREHCVHPTTNRQYDTVGRTFFCTRCGGVFGAQIYA